MNEAKTLTKNYGYHDDQHAYDYDQCYVNTLVGLNVVRRLLGGLVDIGWPLVVLRASVVVHRYPYLVLICVEHHIKVLKVHQPQGDHCSISERALETEAAEIGRRWQGIEEVGLGLDLEPIVF